MSTDTKPTRKKTPSKRTVAAHKARAESSRHELVDRLREDLRATKEALKVARTAAKAELKLAKTAAKAEIQVLKDLLIAAQKREQALVKLGKQKTKEMLKAGHAWEQQQLEKIKTKFGAK